MANKKWLPVQTVLTFVDCDKHDQKIEDLTPWDRETTCEALSDMDSRFIRTFQPSAHGNNPQEYDFGTQ